MSKIDKVTGLELDHSNARSIAEASQDPETEELAMMVVEDPSTLTNLAACYLDLAIDSLPKGKEK